MSRRGEVQQHEGDVYNRQDGLIGRRKRREESFNEQMETLPKMRLSARQHAKRTPERVAPADGHVLEIERRAHETNRLSHSALSEHASNKVRRHPDAFERVQPIDPGSGIAIPFVVDGHVHRYRQGHEARPNRVVNDGPRCR